MIVGLDHVNIQTTDLAQTVRFYQDVLGLQSGPRPPSRRPGAWLYAGDQPVVHLVEVSQLPEGQGVLDHFAFLTENYSAVRQSLVDRGIDFGETHLPDWSIRQIFLHDPNGIRLELQFRNV